MTCAKYTTYRGETGSIGLVVGLDVPLNTKPGQKYPAGQERLYLMARAYDTSATRPGPQEALGQSEAFLTFQEQLSRVARVDRPVILIGERGSGKELAAERIHFLSGRWQEPFIQLNCAALPATLIEAELFGHEAGAFTGAARQRRGRFESATGGTLFLDEIALIPIEVQEKILRVVEYGCFERVGSSEPIAVNVRIVAATNQNLSHLAQSGSFMRDLLDRLSFEVLFLPPLRERPEDILLLARHFAARMAMELNWPQVPEITDEAERVLLAYPWPGNVRELKNVIERAVYRSDDAVIEPEECIFDPFLSPFEQRLERRNDGPRTGVDGGDRFEPDAAPAIGEETGFDEAVRALELRMMRRALRKAQYNQRRAADLLKLSYHQFRGIYRKYKDDLEPSA